MPVKELVWTVPTCRLLQHDQDKGPLLLMVVRMCTDVINFVLLVAGPMLGFAAAFVTSTKASWAPLARTSARASRRAPLGASL